MLTVIRVLQVLAEVYARQAQQESLLRLGQSTPGILLCTWCVTRSSKVQLHTPLILCDMLLLCRPS